MQMSDFTSEKLHTQVINETFPGKHTIDKAVYGSTGIIFSYGPKKNHIMTFIAGCCLRVAVSNPNLCCIYMPYAKWRLTQNLAVFKIRKKKYRTH